MYINQYKYINQKHLVSGQSSLWTILEKLPKTPPDLLICVTRVCPDARNAKTTEIHTWTENWLMDLKKTTSSSDRVGPGPGLSSLTLMDCFFMFLNWSDLGRWGTLWRARLLPLRALRRRRRTPRGRRQMRKLERVESTPGTPPLQDLSRLLCSVFSLHFAWVGQEGTEAGVNLASIAFKETDVSDDFFLQNFLNSCKSAVK